MNTGAGTTIGGGAGGTTTTGGAITTGGGRDTGAGYCTDTPTGMGSCTDTPKETPAIDCTHAIPDTRPMIQSFFMLVPFSEAPPWNFARFDAKSRPAIH